MDRPIHRAACPCCACTLVSLSGHDDARVWSCASCGYSLMGLAVPFRRRRQIVTRNGRRTYWQEPGYVPFVTTLEATSMTEIRS